MKKIIAIILCACLLGSFAACGETKNPDVTAAGPFSVYVPDGAPALSVAGLPVLFGSEAFDLHVVKADSIAAHAQQNADIAIMPVIAAAKLFSAGDKMKLVSVVTHGNLFLSGNGEADELTDLYGKTLGVIQRGNVPDLTLQTIFAANEIEYIESETPVVGKIALKYFADAGEMLPSLKQGVIDFGILPEPAATNSELPVRFSLQELYGQNAYPQAVMMIKTSVLDSLTKIQVNDLLQQFDDSIAWVKENVDGRPAAAVAALTPFLQEGMQTSLDGSKLTNTSIVNCNMYLQKIEDNVSDSVIGYLTKLSAIAPSAISLVTSAFFY